MRHKNPKGVKMSGEELKLNIQKSISNYLHRNGFTKSLQRFQSETKIQDDSWKSSSDNLEDIYSKYIIASRQTIENVVVESELKAKKKKKSKQEVVSGDETKEAKPDAELKKPVDDTVTEVIVKESKKKSKSKKSKSDEQEVVKGDVESDVVKEDKKSSKKRKRVLAEENEDESDKVETNQTVEETKKQEVDESDKPEINNVEKSGSQKSGKKQRIGSAEPKTVNAFQRVKIDEVEFAHEKLQDNSYWAKNGADIGYGAKAQEVLGQVRGRDFRHEKTKKKRGSYRGGQIDLHSHSIKFEYSEEE